MQVIPASELTVSNVAETVRLAVAPVFLLSGIAAFVNVCASRLSRIVDRSRKIEPLLLGSRGAEHARWLREINVIDQRMRLVSLAISLSVLSAILICAVVIMLFAGSIVRVHRHRDCAALHRLDGLDRPRLRGFPGRDPGWLARRPGAHRSPQPSGGND